MENIDWDKAPEWAEYVVIGICSGVLYWANDFRRQSIGSGGSYKNNIHSFEKWPIHSKRPSWSGEGLPPVGVVCEVEYDTGRELWHEAEVIYHKSDDPRFAAVRLRGSHHDKLVWCSQFRPMRTPEQIAADEREAAIKSLAELIGQEARCAGSPLKPGTCLCIARTLVIDGYRKQDAK